MLKKELEQKLTEQLNFQPEMTFVSDYNPDGALSGIQAISFESVSYQGKKTKVFAYLGVPDSLKPGGKAPAILLIHGGGGHAYACWVKMWNDRGFAALALDTTGFFPRERNAGSREGGGDESCWERALQGVFAEEGFIPAPDNDRLGTAGDLFENQWMFHALCASVRANSILRGHPLIDETRVGVTGISWGGVITSLLIGYDTRFAFAVPVYGSGYLGEGLGEVSKIFTRPEVRERWLAEHRFDQVAIPVLWLGWNDDSAFSIQSNSLSFAHTVKNNPLTSLSLKSKMMHSHQRGWRPQEIYYFAESVVGEKAPFPRFISQPSGRNFALSIRVSPPAALTQATAYYITGPMRYEKSDKYLLGERNYMSEDWKTVRCTIEGDQIRCRLPSECAAYYVEVAFQAENQEFVISSEFILLSSEISAG